MAVLTTPGRRHPHPNLRRGEVDVWGTSCVLRIDNFSDLLSRREIGTGSVPPQIQKEEGRSTFVNPSPGSSPIVRDLILGSNQRFRRLSF